MHLRQPQAKQLLCGAQFITRATPIIIIINTQIYLYASTARVVGAFETRRAAGCVCEKSQF